MRLPTISPYPPLLFPPPSLHLRLQRQGHLPLQLLLAALALLQGGDLVDHGPYVLEAAVDGGEADVGHVVDVAQAVHHQLADAQAIDLAPAQGVQLGLDLAGRLLQVSLRDGALGAGRAHALEHLVQVELLAPAVALDDQQVQGRHPLVGGETLAALLAFPPPADAVRHLAGVDHPGIVAVTEGTFHRRSLSLQLDIVFGQNSRAICFGCAAEIARPVGRRAAGRQLFYDGGSFPEQAGWGRRRNVRSELQPQPRPERPVFLLAERPAHHRYPCHLSEQPFTPAATLRVRSKATKPLFGVAGRPSGSASSQRDQVNHDLAAKTKQTDHKILWYYSQNYKMLWLKCVFSIHDSVRDDKGIGAHLP